MNIAAQAYGMADNDFYSFLTKDADEAESLRIAREEEQEKAMYSGRKSRRERRQHKYDILFISMYDFLSL